MKLGALRRQWAKRISVILVPEGGARTFTLHFRTVLLAIGAALTLLLFAGTVTLFFSQGRLLGALQENAQMQRKIRSLEKEIEKVRTLETQLAESQRLRAEVLTIMGARGVFVDSVDTGDDAVAWASTAGDELGAAQVDFLRSVPTVWPVRGPVTRGFASPGSATVPYHPGLDIAASTGTPVLAAGDGTVTFAGSDPEYGNLIILEHGLGLESRYGHNSRLSVQVGDRVTRGRPVALVGSTGNSTAPHLHLEIHKDGVPVDPLKYLN
jgi:murein DD-endopeptidase MepM/ murein hydrolase activator NlpD